MSETTVAEVYHELARRVGSDGHEYVVRPLHWSLDKVHEYWQKFEPFHIFTDELPQNDEGFLYLIIHMNGLWFDIWDETEQKVVGVIYLSDIAPMLDGSGIFQATWHATVWDAKAAPRRDVARAATIRLMKMLKIHRLVAEIPLYAGGAIRNAQKLGFVSEGTMRAARRSEGRWHDVALLSLLDSEVD